MDDRSKTLFQTEVSPLGLPIPPYAVEPLPCDRWLAASALQKAIRRGDALTAERAARTLYRYDPRSAWRRLLVIAYEDIGIGALGAVVVTTLRGANAKAYREAGGDEAAALATSQMLASAPKDRSADLLFATALHDPALEHARSKLRSVSLAQRLEFVADPTLSLPERALAAWHSSGVEERGERRVGPGDLGGLMRTYAELGVPEPLLEAVALALKKTREPFVLMLPLLCLAAAEGETELVDLPLTPSSLINGVPLYAIDKHTRLGRQAIGRFARENAEIAQFLSAHARGSRDEALGMAVFYADGALTRPTLQWRLSAEITAAGVAADFHKVNVAAGVGVALIRLVSEHIADLNAIRSEMLGRALPNDG
jgi:MgsA AAA+ ATPase C terminal